MAYKNSSLAACLLCLGLALLAPCVGAASLEEISEEARQAVQKKAEETRQAAQKKAEEAIQATLRVKEPTLVKLETTLGDIVIELNKEKAPRTCANFLQYVQEGAYNGTIFHRVISNFMIQGGGFDLNLQQKPSRAPIANEADNGLKNAAYTVAMARTNEAHSASNQFFINVEDNDFLNHREKTAQGWGYCVFGRVVQGMAVVDKIKLVPTRTKGFYENVPGIPVVINKASVTSGFAGTLEK